MNIVTATATSSDVDYVTLPIGEWLTIIQSRTADVDVELVLSSDTDSIFTVKSGTSLEIPLLMDIPKEIGFRATASTVVEFLLSPMHR